MEELEKTILDIEWEMFSSVNEGRPKASCQQDEVFYKLMRKSQLLVWEPEVRASYLADLNKALEEGRNIMIEKYAYMMAFTDPEYFAAIEHLLPEVSNEKRALADRITAIQTAEAAAISEGQDGPISQARPVSSSQDAAGSVSSETYSRCELWTYSAETLKLLLDQIERMELEGRNYVLEVLQNTARAQRTGIV